MTDKNVMEYFQYDHLSDDLKRVSKLFHDMAEKIEKTPSDKIKSLLPELERLSDDVESETINGDKGERNKSLFKIHLIMGIAKFKTFGMSYCGFRKQKLGLLLEAKDAAVRSMVRVKKN